MTVALRGPRLGALVWSGTDHRGQLGFNRRLIQRLGRGADPVINLSALECLQSLQQGRLSRIKRVNLLREVLGGFSNASRDDPSTLATDTITTTQSQTYTTSRDAPGPGG